MKRFAPVLLSALLAGCSWFSTTPGDSTGSSSSVAELPETRNVSYTGTVEDLGPSVYMEGTHQLRLADGKIVLLQSGLLTLDDYVGLEIVAFGAVRPTTEAGGIIMRVESVTVLSVSSAMMEESSSSSSEEAMMEESSSSTAAVVSSVASSVSSVAPVVSSKAVSSAAPVASSAPANLSAEMEARVKVMAKEDIAASRWTQQYCTSHIGFCVPIHKNWWFTSFGTAGSALWHVEVSSEEIQGLGDGPIAINLMTGSLEGTGAADGSVVERDGKVIAYRSWEDNTHFEISAPVALRAAVTYMGKSITSYSVAQ